MKLVSSFLPILSMDIVHNLLASNVPPLTVVTRIVGIFTRPLSLNLTAAASAASRLANPGVRCSQFVSTAVLMGPPGLNPI